MTGDPVSVEPDAAALEAWDRMVDRGIRHLPVVDREHRVVGVLSVEDLRAALPFAVDRGAHPSPPQREAARGWRVGDVMTHAPETIHEEAGLGEAAERMAEARVGCLPVVDEAGRLAALLSETDLLHALAAVVWAEGRSRPRAADDPTERLVRGLERERERLRAQVAAHRDAEDALGRELREVPLDAAERAADTSEIGRLEALDHLAWRRLEAIEAALERVAAGRLTQCERCAGPIPLTRLRALPGTTLCVACARAGPG